MSRKIRLKNIYLQNYFEDFGYYDDGCTWCEDKINDEDIEYILQSEYDKLRAENEKLKALLYNLYEACMRADFEGDLSEYIDGDILDAVKQALNEVTKC